MLNKEEEYRVLSVIEFVKPFAFKEPHSPIISSELALWLAEKLKEVNEELGDVIAELNTYKCEHLDTTKTKDLQDNPIRVCADCDSEVWRA